MEPPAPSVEIPAGQEVTIDGSAFGFQPGRVIVAVGGMQLDAQVTNWTNEQVRAVIPQLPIAAAANATVVVLRADGNVANQLTAQLVPSVQPAFQALASR
ncbi:MAG: IPT/TIG domain-containing protein [Planctomycetaceae bacterium]